MSFNLEYAPAAETAGHFHPGSKNFRQDERAGSQSGSDDGTGYVYYTDPHKPDIDSSEEHNVGLTSQTLNADGTPKRPMNAFMIFARRRRPQVSAENQSMRTGEISKILSKEWNAMEMPEKQFYLDQAKQLKENFNTKYPDYVYRRRPNNSRKRRKTDTASNRLDNPLPIDAGDDFSGGTEFGEHSSIEGEELTLENGADLHYTRAPHDNSASYNDHNSFVSCQSRSSSYSYPSSEVVYRQIESHESRIPYLPSTHERLPHEISSMTSLGSSRASSPLHYPYITSQSHSSSSPMYPIEQNNGHSWESQGATGRVVPSNWSGDRNERPLSSMSSKSNYSSPASPAIGWSDTAPVINTTNSPTSLHSHDFPFPTLNSPFYPHQPQMQGHYSTRPSTSSTSSLPSPTSQYGPIRHEITDAGSHTGRHSAPYDPHGYTRSSSISPLNGYAPSANQEVRLFQTHHTRPLGLQRLPSVPTMSTFAHSPLASPGLEQSVYWGREKLEGQ